MRAGVPGAPPELRRVVIKSSALHSTCTVQGAPYNILLQVR